MSALSFGCSSSLSFHRKEISVKEKFGRLIFRSVRKIKHTDMPHRLSIYNQLIEVLHSTTNKTEIAALKFLFQEYKISTNDLVHILQGAHVLLGDNGRFHRLFKNAEGARSRLSSHPSDAKGELTYSFQGSVVRELLFAKLSTDRAIKRLAEPFGKIIQSHVTKAEITLNTELSQLSWFQLERNPMVNLRTVIGHSYNYICYKVTKKQQGPFGVSLHVDTRPIFLHPR